MVPQCIRGVTARVSFGRQSLGGNPCRPARRVPVGARPLAALFNPMLYPEQPTDLQLSQEEVGYLSGVSRQRVNQALQVLEKANLLRVDYGRIRILDLDGLRGFGS